MAAKPTYEELEQSIQELKQAESKRKSAQQTLHYEAALLEAQLNSSIDGIIVVDVHGKKILQNQRTVELWKIPQHIADNNDDKVQVQHVMQMTKNPEQFVEKIAHLYKHPDETSRDEVELTDGTVFDRYSAPVVGKDGQNYGRIWTFRDITDRKRAETALINSELKWRNILLNTPQIGVSLDPQAKITFANARFLKLTGWMEHEVIGQDWFDIFIPEHVREEIRVTFRNVMSQIDITGFSTYENEIVTKSGKLLNVAWSNVLTKDTHGNIVDVTCLGIDLTERKKAEEALRKSEKDLKASQRIAHLGSWHLDLATNQVEWAEELYNMYGFDPTIPPPPYSEHMKLFTPESWEKLSAALARTRETGIPYELELETVRKDGTSGWMWVRGEGEKDSAGNTIGLWGAAQDITERKRAEKEKEDLESTLRQALKMEAVGRLAGGVAHDFNNMLSVIIGHAEMAMEGVDPAQPLYANLEEIKNAGERSADLTRQLLAFARKQTVAPKVLDLNKTVGGMTRMLQRLIGEDIDLAWLPYENLWPVKMDPTQIDQILANLCVNARDAIADVGKITIETGNIVFDETYCNDHIGFMPGEYVLLTVSDNGCGMDTVTIDNIFEPFFTTKESGKGTGLGLATVYGVVKQNNGFINVYSEPGQGTTFRIYLPRHLTKTTHSSAKRVTPAPERGHETILLVEDEPAILRMTTMMLERLGYTVVAARSPGEAISLAQEHTGIIDLLVTDVVMPEMNGRDLAKNVLSFNPNLKRLFMSGYTANVIAHHGVLDEGVNFIQKPFSRENFGAKVREVLDADND